MPLRHESPKKLLILKKIYSVKNIGLFALFLSLGMIQVSTSEKDVLNVDEIDIFLDTIYSKLTLPVKFSFSF